MDIPHCSWLLCVLCQWWSFMTVADERHADEAIADGPVAAISICG
jgi:hypothetical protein